MDKQKEAERQAQLSKKDVARQQRQAQLTELAGELPRLRTLCQGLQERLNSTDLQNSLPVELRKQSAELERLARQINKQVRGL
jgi:hypothetical protein